MHPHAGLDDEQIRHEVKIHKLLTDICPDGVVGLLDYVPSRQLSGPVHLAIFGRIHRILMILGILGISNPSGHIQSRKMTVCGRIRQAGPKG